MPGTRLPRIRLMPGKTARAAHVLPVDRSPAGSGPLERLPVHTPE